MSDIAIRVDRLGKQYHIGSAQGGTRTYKSLRDSIASAASAPFRAARAFLGRNEADPDVYDKTIWALDDVSFEIRRGEIVGVIGRNGAGKSTLLKILSRITEPTTGRVEMHGRAGSLLEVGTGFHPELTGRDNIYLNGSILGMRRTEIARQFDAIVAFSEVEEFIDTPVKHYSTGMYLRLAFAVAAHLETEILLVDEVLAVGDLQFQEKCLGKMQDVAASGRTVLFVSHSIASVQRLCTRGLLFAGGKLTVDSSPAAVIAEYIGGHPKSTFVGPASATRPMITSASLTIQDQTLLLSVEFQSPFPVSPPILTFVIYNSLGVAIYGTHSGADPGAPLPPSSTAGRFEVAIPAVNFRPDRYLVSLWLSDQHTDFCTLEMILQINLTGVYGGELSTQFYGNIYLPTQWKYDRIDPAESSTTITR